MDKKAIKKDFNQNNKCNEPNKRVIMTKRFFMLLAVAMAAVVVHAEDFTANGIKYTGDESTKTATVTGTEDGFNQTDLVIPEVVNGYTGPVHTTPAATDSTWYTLDGRRVKQPAAKGIYINNGRKVVVR